MANENVEPKLSGEERRRAYELLHILWGKGIEGKEYVKSEWREFSNIIEKAGIDGKSRPDAYTNKCKGCFSELHLGFCSKRTCDYHNKAQPT